MDWPFEVLVFILINSLAVSTIQPAQAQCPVAGTVPVGFTVDKMKVCVGSPIKITESATVKSTAYNYNYNGTTPVSSLTLVPLVSSYTYTQPGSYTILQAGSGNGTAVGFTYCQQVTVLPLDPIKFTAKGCSARKALVDVTLDASTGQYDNYIINWGDGMIDTRSRATIVTQQAHTYSGNGPYTISITGAYAAPANCSGPKTNATPITLTAAPAVPTIVTLKTISDNSISIQYSASAGTAVQLYQKVGGTYTPTGQNGVSAGTFSVMTDAKQSQCFQVITQDACNSAGLASDEVCSLVLDAQAANKQNNLSWQPYAGTATLFRYYRVLRNNAPTGGTLTSRGATTYTDANKIECGVSYCYTIEATVGPTTITSAPSCVTGINGDVPGSFTNVIVSVENNHPRIVATLPVTGTSSSYSMIVSRASGPGGPFTPVSTAANKNTFVDEVDASAGSYCYEVTYQNNCSLTSAPSKPVCSVYLSSKSPTSVDWTTDSPFAPGAVARYSIEVIDSINGTKNEYPLGGNSHYEPDPNDPNLQSQKYRVIATSATGAVSYSNFFTFRREAKIITPDAFTPNNDGLNDVYLPKGIYVDTFKMNIYDRWGEVVFSTTDKLKGWDGTIGGQPAMKGQYMYRIDIEDLTGQKTVRTGAVLLLR